MLRSCLAVVLGFGLITQQPTLAIFGIFSKDKDRLPTKNEVAKHDSEASKLFASAEQAQKAGKAKKAMSQYSTIGRKFYFSKFAPEAAFRNAELLLANGEPLDSFSYYQTVVDRYRSSPRFQRSLEQQYNIAVASLTDKNGSFFGVVPKKTSRDRVIQMFEAIIKNAPASIYAANSQYYIARIYEGRKEYDSAIKAFQTVVDEYPRSTKAPEAQLKIAEIYEKTARRPDNPSNLKESREAYEDFITNFPKHREREDAFAQLNAIDEKEAKKSLKIGQYYQKKGNMKAAAIYYKDVLRSNNAALKAKARQGIDAISVADPEALKAAEIEASEATASYDERLKNQRNYLGPPAPEVANKKTPLVASELNPALLPVVPDEPGLPSLSAPIEAPPLVPAPDPVSANDVLGGVVIDPNTDIDSLLPPIE
jgi:outer membrane protein assembly factor BamD